ncbi:Peptidase S8/S53 domain [Sesbania bispinosa]|nr:Peptidase S8/S53 domain [Sesbania bispinosa]
MLYSYTKHINGFAAVLEEEEAANLQDNLDTGKVFAFHCFVLAYGAWPESPSFSDDGIGPIPSRWKGTCENDITGFRCNRKLIGARYFNKGYASYLTEESVRNSTFNSARDYEGHGSHTLSTLGGNFVDGANVLGMGNGTAKGGSPKARLATYKVCWPPIDDNECFDSDILAALDTAISDGVDVISLSIGGSPMDYFNDAIAIGAFHATMNGITVVCAGGNSGPGPGTVSNTAPWIITVGASTLDRKFESIVELSNGQVFKGYTLSNAVPEDKLYPLIRADVAKKDEAQDYEAVFCKAGTIDPEKAKGKILVCLRGDNERAEKSLVAFEAGAVGMILYNDEYTPEDYKNPMAYLHPPKTLLQIKPSPTMAFFSSRGPNIVTPEILKPDITAPGVNIIAAYSQGTSPSDLDSDNRRIPFITMSGTSMATPHVAGVVGLLKTLHPNWSPAAIKSAIMTTTMTWDNTFKPMVDDSLAMATPYDYGTDTSHQIGQWILVWSMINITDYLNMLCASGYNQTQIASFYGAPYNCPYVVKILDFNYPAIVIPKLYGTVTLTRRVKNVGKPGIYAARIRVPPGLSVSVEPRILKFDRIDEEKSFS